VKTHDPTESLQNPVLNEVGAARAEGVWGQGEEITELKGGSEKMKRILRKNGSPYRAFPTWM